MGVCGDDRVCGGVCCCGVCVWWFIWMWCVPAGGLCIMCNGVN